MQREGYPVQITVKSSKLPCHQEHKTGDTWLIKDGLTPAGMCANSFHSLGPTIRALRFGGEFPWNQTKDIIYCACPSRTSRLIWELKRLRGEVSSGNDSHSLEGKDMQKVTLPLPFKVQIMFHSIDAGQCPKGHKIGDSWLIDKDGETPGGICKSAFTTLQLALNVLRYGGGNPWDLSDDTSLVCCPSATHRVIFNLKRIR